MLLGYYLTLDKHIWSYLDMDHTAQYSTQYETILKGLRLEPVMSLYLAALVGRLMLLTSMSDTGILLQYNTNTVGVWVENFQLNLVGVLEIIAAYS